MIKQVLYVNSLDEKVKEEVSKITLFPNGDISSGITVPFGEVTNRKGQPVRIDRCELINDKKFILATLYVDEKCDLRIKDNNLFIVDENGEEQIPYLVTDKKLISCKELFVISHMVINNLLILETKDSTILTLVL